jgi:ADP-ribose pyrophosphatase YjhB (NUDIX family)
VKRKGEKVKAHHFVTGKFTSHATWLSEKKYAMVLDNVVITCVDIICLYRGKMLVGKRTQEPWPKEWIVGGRQKPGESFEQAGARNLKRELGLTIDPRRLRYFSATSLVWDTRAQPPQHHGCHVTSITLVCRLSRQEVAAIRPNEEYSEVQWVEPRSIIRRKKFFHPALVVWAKQLDT